MTDNPLLQPWTTPFGVPPFDRHICTLTAKDGKVVRAQLSALD